MYIVPIIGMAGSGKTTQASLLKANGYITISTGDLLRTLSKSSASIRRQIESGYRVSPAITSRLIALELHKHKDRSIVVLDGSPLSIEELSCLRKDLKPLGATITMIIHLCVGASVAKQRSIDRGRDDDNADILDAKIQNFYKYTKPLLEHPSVRVVNVNACQSKEWVSNEVINCISNLSVSTREKKN